MEQKKDPEYQRLLKNSGRPTAEHYWRNKPKPGAAGEEEPSSSGTPTNSAPSEKPEPKPKREKMKLTPRSKAKREKKELGSSAAPQRGYKQKQREKEKLSSSDKKTSPEIESEGLVTKEEVAESKLKPSGVSKPVMERTPIKTRLVAAAGAIGRVTVSTTQSWERKGSGSPSPSPAAAASKIRKRAFHHQCLEQTPTKKRAVQIGETPQGPIIKVVASQRMMKELPSELWGLVLGKMKFVRDFARLQLVSRSFNALVKAKCWTKVKEMEVMGFRVYVDITLCTGIPCQSLQLPAPTAAELLEKLVQKATNTTSVYLYHDGWGYNGDLLEDAIRRFLDSLASDPLIKIKRFWLPLSIMDRTTILDALARFLNAKKQFLIALRVSHYPNLNYRKGHHLIPIPDHLLQAFRDCQALENVDIHGSDEYVGILAAVLHEKPQLQTLGLTAYKASASAVALLQSGVSLRQFRCPEEEILLAYIEEVHRRKRTLDHPLRSLTKLNLPCFDRIFPLPWAIFPSLEHLSISCQTVSIEATVALVQSFFIQWAESDEERAMELQIKLWSTPLNGTLNLAEVVTGVQAACGCHVTLTHPGIDFGFNAIFRKGKASLKLSR